MIWECSLGRPAVVWRDNALFGGGKTNSREYHSDLNCIRQMSNYQTDATEVSANHPQIITSLSQLSPQQCSHVETDISGDEGKANIIMFFWFGGRSDKIDSNSLWLTFIAWTLTYQMNQWHHTFLVIITAIRQWCHNRLEIVTDNFSTFTLIKWGIIYTSPKNESTDHKNIAWDETSRHFARYPYIKRWSAEWSKSKKFSIFTSKSI